MHPSADFVPRHAQAPIALTTRHPRATGRGDRQDHPYIVRSLVRMDVAEGSRKFVVPAVKTGSAPLAGSQPPTLIRMLCPLDEGARHVTFRTGSSTLQLDVEHRSDCRVDRLPEE